MSRFVRTLLESAARSERGITTGEPHAPVRSTWGEVHERARVIAGSLVARGLRPGAAVAVLAAEPVLIAPAIQAVWLGGGSVTMLHQPTQRTDLAAWATDTLRVLDMIDAELVLLGAPFEPLADVLTQHGIRFELLSDLPAATALSATGLTEAVEVGEDATALLQLTSGSTADPKAVRITHGNLFANMTAMVERSEINPADAVLVSWLPLFHDMGMIGFLTVPMTYGIELVKVTPTEFLSRPLLWPQLISRYRATHTAAPNFAYAIVGKRLSTADPDIDRMDLSSLRYALNGAEPIDVQAVQLFIDAGAPFGLRPDCVVCAYGMAESTLGVSFAATGGGMRIDVIDAGELEEHRRAVPVTSTSATGESATEKSGVAESGVAESGVGESGAEESTLDTPQASTRAFPLLGKPLRGIEVRVVGMDGQPVGEREVGVLEVRGDSVTPGYLTVDGPLPTQDADGWLDTGDEGYLVDGQVVVCGRRKDVIIMGGRNVYPTDIERAACEVSGVRPGNAVAVRLDAGQKRERFAVAVESKSAGDDEAAALIRKEVTARVVDAIGLRPSAVVVLAPGTLPKTPSGKLRRSAAAQFL